VSDPVKIGDLNKLPSILRSGLLGNAAQDIDDCIEGKIIIIIQSGIIYKQEIKKGIEK